MVPIKLLLWTAFASFLIIVSQSLSLEDANVLNQIKHYLTTQISQDNLFFPRQDIQICLVKKVVALDDDFVTETLRVLQSSRKLAVGTDEVQLFGTLVIFDYHVSSSPDCQKTSNIWLTLETISGSQKQGEIRLVGSNVVEGVINLGERRMSKLEMAGRVAGWIVASTNAWIGSDLMKPLFFSPFEDDGAEISIIGLHREKEQDDPLRGIDLPFLRAQVAGWIGADLNHTTVKATTRSLADHPGILAALLRAERSGASSSQNGLQSQRTFDADEFLRTAADSSDSLLRIGSAARLIRMRRREVEVYVMFGQDEEHTFEHNRRVHVYGEDVAVMVPPATSASKMNINELILSGLSQSLGGVPHRNRFEDLSESTLRSLRQKAVENSVLFELHKTMKMAKDALLVPGTSAKVDIERFAVTLASIRRLIGEGSWSEARTLLRGEAREVLRQMLRISRQERKKCCTKVLTSGAPSSNKANRRKFFLYIYLAVALSILVGVVVLVSRFRGTSKAYNLTRLFGRIHMD